MKFSPMCAQRELVIVPWERVRVFFSPRTKELTQLAMGQVEQLKGCEKTKGAILAAWPFYFEKNPLLSAMNGPLELQGAVPVNPHLFRNWVSGHSRRACPACWTPATGGYSNSHLPSLAAWRLESAG